MARATCEEYEIGGMDCFVCKVTPRIRPDHSVSQKPIWCTIKNIRSMFIMPIHLAAEKLGVCITLFKRFSGV